jgi:hypothetical protein
MLVQDFLYGHRHFHIFGSHAAEAAVRHCFPDVKPQYRSPAFCDPDGVRQEHASGSALEERWREPQWRGDRYGSARS